MKYAISIRSNRSPGRNITKLFPRPMGRLSHTLVVWCMGCLDRAVARGDSLI